MSNFEEQSRFPETGRMVMPGDSVIGGPNAPINLTFRVLFDRTRWLKNTLAEYKAAADRTDTQKADKTIQLAAGAGLTGGGTLAGNRTFALGTPSKITATSTNAAVSNTHSHEIDKASPTVAGVVRTNNTLTGTSDSEALSAAMGKKLNDEKLGNRGDQIITDGMLTVGRANVWNKLSMLSGQGKWIFEAHPSAAEAVADSIRFNFKFEEPGKKAKVLRFHAIGDGGETVAYQSWVAAKAAEAASGKANTKKLTEEDLNSITFPGIYGQILNIYATPERNYPTAKAGSLLSMPSAYNSDTDLASHQIYIPFDADEVWRRGKRNGGRWTEWAKITVSPAELEEAVRTAAGQAVLLTGAQTARGVKTFSDGLKTTTPAAVSNDTSVATTEFVQRAVGQAVLLTGVQTVRGVKTFSDGLKTPTPVATSNDTSVATTAFVKQMVEGVIRKTGSFTLPATANGQTANQMGCDWQTIAYPDGRIVHRYHIKHARDIYFEPEDDNVAAVNVGSKGVTIALPLISAMPGAVFEVRAQVIRATNREQSSTYNNEAAEQAIAWNLRKQEGNLNKVYLDMARTRGSDSEPIDILVYVEGY
nr:MAG TPA: tail fiber protein [Caudoviricetes sp.]